MNKIMGHRYNTTKLSGRLFSRNSNFTFKTVFFAITLTFTINVSLHAQLRPNLIGDAVSLGNNCFVITPDDFNQRGGVWYDNPIDFSNDFIISFQGNFGNKDADGADGMALVFKGNPQPDLGSAGAGIGYQGISPSLTVEFDTWQNADLGDPVWDHIAILRNGNPDHNEALTNLIGPVQASATSDNIEDNMDHEIKIEWNSDLQVFRVFFDCQLRTELDIDVMNDIFSGDNTVFFGFVASTGAFANSNQVCFNSISFVEDLQLADQQICIGSSIEIDATIASGVTYSWSPIEEVSDPTVANPIFSPSVTTVYSVRIEDVCGDLVEEDVTIFVNPLEPTFFNPVEPICEGDTSFVLPTISLNGVEGIWTPTFDNTTTQTYTFLPTNPCAEQVSLEVLVTPLEVPIFEPVDPICEGSFLPVFPSTSSNGITGTWTPQPNNLQTTTYTFTPDEGQCAATATVTVEVLPIRSLSLTANVVSGAFEDNQIVQAQVEGGTGVYEYQLDGGPWQLLDTFENISGCGPHILRVREASGCSNVASDDFFILEFPNFFTPNGDNTNDIWNIECLRDQTDATIAIFDRYGKLIVRISPSGPGWNGTYNGRNLPSADYWFKVDYATDLGRRDTFSSHFTLKR